MTASKATGTAVLQPQGTESSQQPQLTWKQIFSQIKIQLASTLLLALQNPEQRIQPFHV